MATQSINSALQESADDVIARRQSAAVPVWMKYTLLLAGIYNLAWGAFTIVWPQAIFQFADLQPPLYPQIWQCVGMIVGVYGIGYLIAAANPMRHWPIVFVGLLGKILGPIGFTQAVVSGSLPLSWGYTILFNDLIWWIPFAAILCAAWKQNTQTHR